MRWHGMLVVGALAVTAWGCGGESGEAVADDAGGSPDAAVEDTGGGTGGPVDAGGTEDMKAEPGVEWTLALDVPTLVAGATMRRFGGYQDAEGMRLYFCGDDGTVMTRTAEGWVDRGLSVSDKIVDCHIRHDGLLAAVGDFGKVWKWAGSNNWQSHDLLDPAPNLRGVWITSLQTLHVVGVGGAIFRLDATTWTDERMPAVTQTFAAITGFGDAELVVVGDNALAYYDGATWVSEALPADPPGTPEQNRGFNAKAVWSSGAAQTVAVGDKGKIAMRDATGVWSFQESNWYGGTPFLTVWGLPSADGMSDEVWALGAKGLARRFDGTEWTIPVVETPRKTPRGDKWPAAQVVPKRGSDEDFIGMFGTPDGTRWIFTNRGKLLEYGDQYQL